MEVSIAVFVDLSVGVDRSLPGQRVRARLGASDRRIGPREERRGHLDLEGRPLIIGKNTTICE